MIKKLNNEGIMEQKEYRINQHKTFMNDIKGLNYKLINDEQIHWVNGRMNTLNYVQLYMKDCPILLLSNGKKLYFSSYLYRFIKK